jgi:isocitrate dehydrogenase
MPSHAGPVDFEGVLQLLGSLHARGLDIIKTEHLYTMDGRPAYSLGQGE